MLLEHADSADFLEVSLSSLWQTCSQITKKDNTSMPSIRPAYCTVLNCQKTLGQKGWFATLARRSSTMEASKRESMVGITPYSSPTLSKAFHGLLTAKSDHRCTVSRLYPYDRMFHSFKNEHVCNIHVCIYKQYQTYHDIYIVWYMIYYDLWYIYIYIYPYYDVRVLCVYLRTSRNAVQ